jgi:hypothetical protein
MKEVAYSFTVLWREEKWHWCHKTKNGQIFKYPKKQKYGNLDT